MDDSSEEWKPLIGWETVYQVSSLGRVRSIDRVVLTKAGISVPHAGRVLKLYDNGKGHLCATLGTRSQSKAVSRLVAKTFVPNPDNKPQVNHIDGNTHNNSVRNLEWVTNSENMLHCTRYLGKKRLEGHNQAKLTTEAVEDMKIVRGFGATYLAISRAFGVSRRAASMAINGKTWVAHAYTR